MYNPNAKRRRIKPYARPTSFDYNVRYDIRQYQDVKYNRVKTAYFQTATNDEVFRVMEGELLVKSTLANSRYNDKELHVFSFANGLQAPNTAAVGQADRNFLEITDNSDVDQRAVRRYILGTIQYMGVAVTEFSPSRDVYEQGFVATIAGLNTLYNNGTDTIYPGQTVCLDLPRLRQSNHSSAHYKRALQQGVPRDKLQFVIRPHDEMLKEYGDLGLVNRFIVGTAISYSRPGDTVDVILHRMNYTTVHEARSGGVPAGNGGGDLSAGLLGTFLSRLVDPSLTDKAAEGVTDILNASQRLPNGAVRANVNKANGPRELAALAVLGTDGNSQDETLADLVLTLSAEALAEDTPDNPAGQIGGSPVADVNAIDNPAKKTQAALDKLANLSSSTSIRNGFTAAGSDEGKLLLDEVPDALGKEIKSVGGIDKLKSTKLKDLANAANLLGAVQLLARAGETLQTGLINGANPGNKILGDNNIGKHFAQGPSAVEAGFGKNAVTTTGAPGVLSLTSSTGAVDTSAVSSAVGVSSSKPTKKKGRR